MIELILSGTEGWQTFANFCEAVLLKKEAEKNRQKKKEGHLPQTRRRRRVR